MIISEIVEDYEFLKLQHSQMPCIGIHKILIDQIPKENTLRKKIIEEIVFWPKYRNTALRLE